MKTALVPEVENFFSPPDPVFDKDLTPPFIRLK